MTINKSTIGNIVKVSSDVIVQDYHVQLSQYQFQTILDVGDSLNRMFASWNFVSIRPTVSITKSRKQWWRYAYEATLEQKVRPYTWSKIKEVRQTCKQYSDIYKQLLLNPNDTELKLDLQKYEDKLSIINIVVARQEARLTAHTTSMSEKSFWSMLPSPERKLLCEKIGFHLTEKHIIEHKYNLRIGNVSLTFTKEDKEVAVVTVTQFNLFLTPDFANDSYKVLLKIEGLILEGASLEEHLVPIVSSEHLSDSPAYFLKVEFEKNGSGSCKLNCVLSTVEIVYQQVRNLFWVFSFETVIFIL